jgi:NADPH-dependent glutamate synthase beta subunit-like oxidoreductase
MMQFGIPKYRMPRDVLRAEVERIEAAGVDIVLNHRVDDLADLMASSQVDAAFLAVGAQIAKRAWVPAGDASRILDAITLLRNVETGQPPLLGRHVVVYGAGNTAMDAARTVRRLGATDPLIVYRRTRDKMPAHEEELQGALEEGVRVKWLSTIKEANAGSIVVEKMRLDESGFPRRCSRCSIRSEDEPLSKKLSAGWMIATPCLKRGDACPAETVLNAITVTACVPITQ